jgi:Ca-activated chloride channel family protein
MDFLWPGFLLLLGLIPLILAVTLWILRRRRRFAVRYSSLALVRSALPRSSRLKRYLPLALFLLALASLVVALGRPVAIVSVPTDQTTIILAIDVSRSMCSTDIDPSRIEAAEAAALAFIQRQKASTQIGIVAFSGFAEMVQAPTRDPELLQGAVESLMTGRRTAVGSGILQSLDAIAEVDPNVAPATRDTSTGVKPTPVPKGAYVPDIIILLSHYSPTYLTLEGERPKAFPEMGSQAMESVLLERPPDLVIHAHAHAGTRHAVLGGGQQRLDRPEARVPVWNVSLPLCRGVTILEMNKDDEDARLLD